MKQDFTVAPPYSILFVMDPKIAEIADIHDGIIGATETCVAVGTLSVTDGHTRVQFFDGSPPRDDLKPESFELWEGSIRTAGTIAVVNAELVVLAQHPVSSVVHLRVLANDLSEPDDIWIQILSS